MKKAIVFGGSGFLGSHVADTLTKQGIETTIFDIKPSPYLKKEQKFIQGSILDREMVDKSMQGKNYVYHLAGQPDIEIGFKEPEHTLTLNIMGTINILEACRQYKIERFIFASSIYVYSDRGGFYKVSKQACELIIEEYQKIFGINYTILRYGSLYGPRSDERNLIYKILKQAILDKHIKIEYDNEEKREYIHVKDAARMSLEILEKEYENAHLMLTGHQKITRGELIDMICEILDNKIKIKKIKKKENKDNGHYKITPYIFKPHISHKLVSNKYIELGQGLLDCMNEIHEKFVTKKS